MIKEEKFGVQDKVSFPIFKPFEINKKQSRELNTDIMEEINKRLQAVEGI